nr:superoxide dismutase family protein [Streptomyces sp. SID11385]
MRPLPRPAATTSVRPAVTGVRAGTAGAGAGTGEVRAGTAPADTDPVAPVVPLAPVTEPAPAHGYGTTVKEEGAAASAPGEHPAGVYRLLLGSRFSTVPKALVPAADLPKALTYKPSLVPAGAGVRVEQRTDGDGTRVTLRVTGLKAGHRYGAHVHTGVCGADPAAAGGHYQHEEHPARSSTGPAHAGPRDEVALDFTADALGDGTATATRPWRFRPGGARSIVIHDAAGAAERAACVSVPFGGR